MSTDKDASYEELSSELEQIIELLQSPGTNLEDAASRYEKGLQIIEKLKKQLTDVENKVKKVSKNSVKKD